MIGDVSVRHAVAADLGVIAPSSYIPQDRLSGIIADERVWIADRVGELAGYAVLDWFGGVHPYLALIWVFPDHRRRRVGTSLLNKIESHCHRGGHTHLFSSSQADEAPPQAWHRRVGFVECGFIAGLNRGGVGEIVYRKELG